MGIFNRIFNKKNNIKTQGAKEDTEKDPTNVKPNQAQFENTYPKLKFGWQFETNSIDNDKESTASRNGEQPAFIRVAKTSLSVLLMKDENQMIKWLKIKDLNGVKVENALELAFKNLLNKYPDVSIGGIDTKTDDVGKIGMILNASIYTGSLILLEQIWEQIFTYLNSNEVHFIVPNSQIVLFGDANNLKGNGYLYGNAKHHYTNSYDAISEFVYLKRKGEAIIELKDEEVNYDV